MTASPRNFVLIGMSGTGKSRVGRLVAERLRWRLIDTDLEIERRAGKVYEALGAKERFRSVLYPDTGHVHTAAMRRETMAWFARWLRPGAGK